MPGGAGFNPHQDSQAGWDDYAKFYLTAMISVDNSTVQNGCLEFAYGHNKSGLIGKLWKPLSDEDMKNMKFIPIETKPGDTIFFDCYSPHRSKPNLTKKPRRILYLTYNKLSDGDHREKYYDDKYKNYPPDIDRDPNKDYIFKV
jgi:ectoine hydroxylase-related dioxygenase (phytanoyl-CoA dioxygenase family)